MVNPGMPDRARPSLTRRAGLAAVAVIFAAIGSVALTQPGQATVHQPGVSQPGTSHPDASQPGAAQPAGAFGRPAFSGAVYGDFTMAGNSVLRCPAGDETWPGIHAACVAASERQKVGNSYYDNDAFYLERNQPAGQRVFDAGQAQLTIPAGATVRYAQLDWGGNTGQASILGLNDLLTTCGDGLWALVPAQRPSTPPAAASPRQQNVQLSFAADPGTQPGQPVTVRPAHFGITGQSVLGVTTKMYSAYANVTTSVANAAAAAARRPGQAAIPATLTVTVGNVWAMSGHGCTAGWSLTVVYGYSAASADLESPDQGLREVEVYSGRHMQPVGATTSISLPGPADDVNTAGVELGLTAYDGDISHSGRFLVGGQAQNDPCSTDTTGSANFFSACAQGALDPFDPAMPIENNFSVDAKMIMPALGSTASPPGSSVDIGMTGASDPYLLQSIVLSENINPAIEVAINGPGQPVHVGQPALMTITVRNPGDVPLYHVGFTASPLTCPGAGLGRLAPGGSRTLICTMTAPKASGPVTVTATGRYQRGDPDLTVSGSASTAIQVLTPVAGVGVSADPQVLRAGQPARLTFTVANESVTAEGPVDVKVRISPALPGCHPAPVRGLRPGAQATTGCVVSPASDVTLAATATAADPYGATARVTSSPLALAVIHPALDIAVLPQPGQVATGEPVNFTVSVHNIGDVPLAVSVVNDVAPACDFSTSGQSLPVQAARSQKCTIKAPSSLAALSDTAQFTAKPVGHTASGVPIPPVVSAADAISGQATGMASVLAPGTRPSLDIEVMAQPDQVGAGQPVNFTVSVHNIGDVPLAVTVVNDVAPACDFSTSGRALPVQAARSQKCTVRAPSSRGLFGDTARFTAVPAGHSASGVPITGTAGAGASISGQATGAAEVLAAGGSTAGTEPGSAGPTGSASSPGPVSSSGGTNASSGGLSAAGTGAAIGVPLLLGTALAIYLGTSLSSRSRRR